LERYTLARVSRPRIPKGQAEFVYGLLEAFGSVHSLQELIESAEATNYSRLFKYPGSTTVRASLRYHLNRFRKADIVRVI